MKIKTVGEYIFLVILLLLSLWSRDWLFFTITLLFSSIIWHIPLRSVLSKWYQSLPPKYKNKASWLFSALVALMLSYFISSYFFGFYSLHSSSMEPTYSSGNRFLMNKFKIGAAKNINDVDDYYRIKGLKKLSRGEVVVFHFPEADTILEEYPKENYHYRKRQFAVTGQYNAILNNTTIYKPVSKRPLFIKRLVGLPGDTIQIIGGKYQVNGQPSICNPFFINRYIINRQTPVRTKNNLLNQAFSQYNEEGTQIVEFSESQIEKEGFKDFVIQYEQPLNMPDPYIFPFSNHSLWNASYWGPAVIPAKGQTVELTFNNLPLYWRIIETYEGNELKIKNNRIYINGRKAKHYTFKMNYYWMAGDNRPHSFDSRYWGFVPGNHVVGVIDKLPFSN